MFRNIKKNEDRWVFFNILASEIGVSNQTLDNGKLNKYRVRLNITQIRLPIYQTKCLMAGLFIWHIRQNRPSNIWYPMSISRLPHYWIFSSILASNCIQGTIHFLYSRWRNWLQDLINLTYLLVLSYII